MRQPCLVCLKVGYWRTTHQLPVHNPLKASMFWHFARLPLFSRLSIAFDLRTVMELQSSQTQALSSTKDQVFEHERLDHTKPSIRLIRILPSISSKGLIQCTISHQDVHASYNCLSYRWGSSIHSHQISLNGMVFRVHQNLFDFLAVVQKSLSGQPLGYYWIDAICIDQKYILERNHQVAQMSQIYSKARHVHLWLGPTPSLQTVLPLFLDAEVENNRAAWRIMPSFNNTISDHITHNEYWERAWVIQELALARVVLVILQDDTIALPHLLTGLRKLYLDGGNAVFTRFSVMVAGESPKRKGIMLLIHHFRHQKCSIPRDRIFSLLSLCDEGSQHFTVDYAKSSFDIAFDILSRSAQLPCLCSITTLFYALRLHEEKGQQASVTEGDAVGPYLEFDCNGVVIEASYKRLASHDQIGVDRIDVQWHKDACCGSSTDEKWRHPPLHMDCTKIVIHAARPYGPSISVFEPQRYPTTSALPDILMDEWTNYVRALGSSVRRNSENKHIFTIRVAFWALASWRREFDFTSTELCGRAKTRKKDYPDFVETQAHGLPLGVRVGYGHWDQKAAEAVHI